MRGRTIDVDGLNLLLFTSDDHVSTFGPNRHRVRLVVAGRVAEPDGPDVTADIGTM
jgi:hypothetical protein